MPIGTCPDRFSAVRPLSSRFDTRSRHENPYHRALPLRAGYFLHWNIIRWLRDNTEAKWYDLGGTDGFHGLHQFKKGMVGDAGVINPVPPVANFAAYRLPLLLGEGAFTLRDGYYAARRWMDVKLSGKAKPTQARPEDSSEAA